MLNEDKIRWMTKAAAFEERERNASFKTNRFFWWDYVTVGMVRSLMCITLGAALVLLVWVLMHLEELLTGVQLDAFLAIGKTALRYYVIVAICYLVISFFVYTVKYRRSEKKMEQYLYLLGKIEKMNEKADAENTASGRKREK